MPQDGNDRVLTLIGGIDRYAHIGYDNTLFGHVKCGMDAREGEH